MKTIKVMLFIFLLFLMVSVASVASGEEETVKFFYGSDPKQHFLLTLRQEHIDVRKAKVAVIVHGGNFVRGSADSNNDAKPLHDFFFSRGYSTASIEYRLCPGVKWPVPVQDISIGIQKIFETLGHMGIDDISEAIYTGHSAGTTAGALMLYSSLEMYLSVGGISKFVGFGGVYSPEALTEAGTLARASCDSDIDSLAFDGKLSVPALLIEGTNDRYDKYNKNKSPQDTSKSHMEYLAGILQNKGIPVQTLWAERFGGCSHICPIELLASGDPAVNTAVDNFLQSSPDITGEFNVSVMIFGGAGANLNNVIITVKDSATNKFVSGAEVILSGLVSQTMTTSTNGVVSLKITGSGQLTIKVTKSGYLDWNKAYNL